MENKKGSVTFFVFHHSRLQHQGTSMGTLLIYLTSVAMGFIRTVWALVLMKPQDEHLSMFTIQTHLSLLIYLTNHGLGIGVDETTR